MEEVLSNFQTVMNSSQHLGLDLDVVECELLTFGVDSASSMNILSQFQDIAPAICTIDEALLLGAPLNPEVINAKSQCSALHDITSEVFACS